MRDFRKLKIWEHAHRIALSTYRLTKNFPKDEIYGLTSQMRRSSASVPTNIAEGCGRNSQAEFVHFLTFAMGSSSELEYRMILAHDLDYVDEKTFIEFTAELSIMRRMLNAFLQKPKRGNTQE